MYLNQSKERGFTLLEMMIVLIIIGISMAAAVPYFLSSIRRFEVRSASQRLADLINFAHIESMRQDQTAYVYPSFFRKDGKMMGPAKSWKEANGLIAFIDDLDKKPTGIASYDIGEEIRSAQVKSTLKLTASLFSAENSANFSPKELGLIIYPNGEMKVSSNYHQVSSGNSGYLVRITVSNRKMPDVCHSLWIDNLARAHNCPTAIQGKNISDEVRQICTCQSAKNKE